MSSGRGTFLSLAFYVASLIAASPLLHAATSTRLEQQYEQARAAMLADLGDPEKSFEFAQLAVEIGDVRGAIAAFERMLLINPQLANIELELGVLYLRAGDAAVARYHIAEALRAPNVPASVRLRAERYLAAAGAESSRNFFHGEFFVGYRYDSDANSGPNSPYVSVFDPFLGQAVSAKLLGDALKQSDYSTQLAGRVSHSYAFSSASGSSWDSALAMSAAFYNRLTYLNQWSANLDTGPTLVLNSEPTTPFQLRPYITGGYSQLDGHDYLQAGGAGVELTKLYSNQATTLFQLQYLHQEFKDVPGTVLSDRTGQYYTANFSQLWLVGRTQFGVLLSGAHTQATATYQSYNDYGGGVSLRVFLAGFAGRAPWSVAANVYRRQVNYSTANATIDPNTTRRDGNTAAGLVFEVPVSHYLSISLAGSYVKNDSNLPNFDYQDSSGMLSFVARF
jgi:tetratricopeptide (TPR) repeat protein